MPYIARWRASSDHWRGAEGVFAIDTQHLIERLADGAQPVARLPRPWRRTVVWLAIALIDLAMFVLVMSPRKDLVAVLGNPSFVLEQLAALATGLTAGFAALASVVPGSNRRVLLLPLLPLAVWLASVGGGCAAAWIHSGPAGLLLRPDWECLPATAVIGAIPAIVIAVMLRRGAPLTPHLTAAVGGLAAAGLGDFGLRFCHAEDASLMVLVWQIGTVFVLTMAAGLAGRWVLGWKTLLRAGR